VVFYAVLAFSGRSSTIAVSALIFYSSKLENFNNIPYNISSLNSDRKGWMTLKHLLVSLVFFMSVLFGQNHKAEANKGLISLWEVKISQTQKIGSVWSGMPSYLYTCKTETIKFPGEKAINKVVFWPNFYWSDTLVSKDTQCVLTNSPIGRALIQKWTSEPLLYRPLSSNYYEGHLDLIGALQVRSFRQANPNLVCRANVLGFYDNSYDPVTDTVTEFKPRYQKALFAPYSGDWSPYKVFASRDLICTTDVALINSWKRNPYWTWVAMPKSN